MKNFIKSLASDGFLYKYRANRAYWTGERELRLLKSLVHRDKVSIDVGANFGEYAYWLEKLCDKVILFEPHPECAAYLKRCIRPSTELYSLGLSDVDNEAILSIPIDLNSNAVTCRASLSKKAVAGFESLNEMPITLARLDNFGIDNVGFIKIDVEGHELEVIKGAEKTIKKCRPTLQVEIEQRHLNCPIQQIFEYIQSLGYDAFFYRDSKLTKFSEFDLERDQLSILEDTSDTGTLLSEKYVNNFLFFSI